MSQYPSLHMPARAAVNIILDGALAAMSVLLSYWLAAPASLWPLHFGVPAGGAIAIWLIGIPFGLSRLHWRFTSFAEIGLLALAALVTAIMLVLLMVGAGLPLPSPTFPVILALVMIVLLTGPRFIYRLTRQKAGAEGKAQNAILVGSGGSAELFLTALAQTAAPYNVTGLIALSGKHIGRIMHGLEVIACIETAEAALARLKQKPDLLIISAPELAGAALAQLLQAAEQNNIRVLRTPNLTSLAPAGQKIELQPIAIEDLLNRQQVTLDRTGLAALVSGQRILVTGAGGSIGAELARQVAALNPAELLLVDNCEFALWQIDLEIAELAPRLPRRIAIADVRDAASITALAQEFRPELVFHAAALKHVPIVEANRLEGLRTNALGTRIVADAAAASGARLMVLVSTDKAVNPSSVMGASKRLAEMYCQALDVEARHHGRMMRCVTVRFGNVLGSTGSVVPLFRRQLAQGGPLTVTDPAMQRYFMTVQEAVGLVLEASAVGLGEAAIPDGGIFVLDMGEPVRITDLARQMIRLAGLRPDEDIEIKFTGLRPGEKLFEELFHDSEKPAPTAYAGLLMATPRLNDLPAVTAALQALAAAIETRDEDAALAVLQHQVPEFCPGDALAVSRAAE